MMGNAIQIKGDVKGTTINGIRLDIVAKLVEATTLNGPVLTGALLASPDEIAVARRVCRLKNKMRRAGYAKAQIMAAMQTRMVNEAQKVKA